MALIEKIGTIEASSPTTTGGFDGSLTFPADLFNVDCDWCAVASYVPSGYDTTIVSTYGRIPLFFMCFSIGTTKKYRILLHAFTNTATFDSTLNEDGTFTYTGSSGARIYDGLKYDVYKMTPSWG